MVVRPAGSDGRRRAPHPRSRRRLLFRKPPAAPFSLRRRQAVRSDQRLHAADVLKPGRSDPPNEPLASHRAITMKTRRLFEQGAALGNDACLKSRAALQSRPRRPWNPRMARNFSRRLPRSAIRRRKKTCGECRGDAARVTGARSSGRPCRGIKRLSHSGTPARRNPSANRAWSSGRCKKICSPRYSRYAQLRIEHLQPGKIFPGVLHPAQQGRACDGKARSRRKEWVPDEQRGFGQTAKASSYRPAMKCAIAAAPSIVNICGSTGVLRPFGSRGHERAPRSGSPRQARR